MNPNILTHMYVNAYIKKIPCGFKNKKKVYPQENTTSPSIQSFLILIIRMSFCPIFSKTPTNEKFNNSCICLRMPLLKLYEKHHRELNG